jgi:hypothetical protein
MESQPSKADPWFQRTNPPYKLRQALPEPCRAIPEMSPLTLYSWAKAYTAT